MGIGMNFVCKCCGYDTGILMLHQGSQDSIQEVIRKYIFTYSQEIDLYINPRHLEEYQHVLRKITTESLPDTSYQYEACVCYTCKKTYERLDILHLKEEEVFVGEIGAARQTAVNPVKQMFQLSSDTWTSLLGDNPGCVFCDERMVTKITEERLESGVQCPKCNKGKLTAGEEFELWD